MLACETRECDVLDAVQPHKCAEKRRGDSPGGKKEEESYLTRRGPQAKFFTCHFKVFSILRANILPCFPRANWPPPEPRGWGYTPGRLEKKMHEKCLARTLEKISFRIFSILTLKLKNGAGEYYIWYSPRAGSNKLYKFRKKQKKRRIDVECDENMLYLC